MLDIKPDFYTFYEIYAKYIPECLNIKMLKKSCKSQDRQPDKTIKSDYKSVRKTNHRK